MSRVTLIGAGAGTADLLNLVTGTGGDDGDPDWQALARSGTTLVIHMGLARLLNIVARLIAAGLPPDTPAAAIASDIQAPQREVITTLALLPARVAAEGWVSPAIVVVGEVAALVWGDARRGPVEPAAMAARRAA